MIPEDLVTVGGHPPPPARALRPPLARERGDPARTLQGLLLAAAFGAVLWSLTVVVLFASLG